MTAEDSSSRSLKITAAADFLADVSSKNYSKAVIKKYLMERRDLTAEEVEVAFLINKKRKEKAKTNQTQGMESKEERRTGSSERPETTTFNSRFTVWDVNYLLPSKRVEGLQLIKKLLDSEKVYCSILNCLKEEYNVKLVRCANLNKFEMTRKEVDEIFLRIPQLLMFHNKFFEDLKRGFDIGQMFVQRFKFFEGYAEYMKNCQQTVNKMRKYVRDPNLTRYMDSISAISAWPNDDMVNLILIPLKRILEYRDFLVQLYSWTDRTQTTYYDLLGKASRRIGRVAAYIEKYKYGICNQNEMNQVQKFLSDQCEILTPDRSIIRRGMMIRRTSGWTARNKRYIFFLFNDMLLWTNRNGSLQNAVQLRNCEVMPSSAKTNADRKFEVVYRGEKLKRLWLECAKISERNAWYEAVKQSIAKAKEISSKAWSNCDAMLSASYKDYAEENSDVDQKIGPDNRSEDDDSKVELESSVNIDNPYSKRYAVTTSFRMQAFKEIDPMDDNLSQISEQDVVFHQKNRQYSDGIIPTSAQLSPFVSSSAIAANRSGSISNIHGSGGPAKPEQPQNGRDRNYQFADKRKKPKIIRKTGVKPGAKPSSQIRLRLDDV